MALSFNAQTSGKYTDTMHLVSTNISPLEMLLLLLLSKPESSLGRVLPTVVSRLVSQTEMFPSKWYCLWDVWQVDLAFN